MAPALLQTRSLKVQFGGVTAVNSVDIDVHAGELVGLIGPNGAGKTSFINAVTGYVEFAGEVLYKGSGIEGFPPHRVAHRGLRRTWQSVELFDDISVRANLEVAATRLTPASALRDYLSPLRSPADRVDEALELLGLTADQERRPSDLPHGRRKLVGVARALVGEAELLLLDEPAAGLDRKETERLGRQLRQITASGPAILLVDHDMSLVMSACSRVHVLDFGELIATGSPDELRVNERVIGAYLGVES